MRTILYSSDQELDSYFLREPVGRPLLLSSAGQEPSVSPTPTCLADAATLDWQISQPQEWASFKCVVLDIDVDRLPPDRRSELRRRLIAATNLVDELVFPMKCAALAGRDLEHDGTADIMPAVVLPSLGYLTDAGKLLDLLERSARVLVPDGEILIIFDTGTNTLAVSGPGTVLILSRDTTNTGDPGKITVDVLAAGMQVFW